VVSQFSGEAPTLKDFIPVENIYPVGRLDKDSEGLMLLTDDGALQHRLTDPKFEHPRTYWAQVEGIPSQAALERLRRGVVLQGLKTRPAMVRILDPQPVVAARVPPIRVRKSIPDTWIELTLIEGRNRQVRRMTAEVGLPTLRLIRVAIGTLKLDNLDPGEWREIPKP
jgi:23S rRNA pseudouridine2457 synthase